MKQIEWLKSKETGAEYILYKGYHIVKVGDGNWYETNNNYISTNVHKVNCYVDTTKYEKLEPSVDKRKRGYLSVKNLKTLIDKQLPSREAI
jgi:hypothetical protein